MQKYRVQTYSVNDLLWASGKRFLVRSDERLTAFLELESAICGPRGRFLKNSVDTVCPGRHVGQAREQARQKALAGIKKKPGRMAIGGRWKPFFVLASRRTTGDQILALK
jgi:hypothetical protein